MILILFCCLFQFFVLAQVVLDKCQFTTLGERAGCLCRFLNGTVGCIDKYLGIEFGGSNNGFRTTVSGGGGIGCFSFSTINGYFTLESLFAECQSILGFCNVGRNIACCLVDDCLACDNYSQGCSSASKTQTVATVRTTTKTTQLNNPTISAIQQKTTITTTIARLSSPSLPTTVNSSETTTMIQIVSSSATTNQSTKKETIPISFLPTTASYLSTTTNQLKTTAVPTDLSTSKATTIAKSTIGTTFSMSTSTTASIETLSSSSESATTTNSSPIYDDVFSLVDRSSLQISTTVIYLIGAVCAVCGVLMIAVCIYFGHRYSLQLTGAKDMQPTQETIEKNNQHSDIPRVINQYERGEIQTQYAPMPRNVDIQVGTHYSTPNVLVD